MKSYLLLAAAALVATTATAQTPKRVSLANRTFQAAPAYMKSLAIDSKSIAVAPTIRRAQGSALNPTAFFKRPKGTFYMGTDDRFYSYSNDMLVFPPTAPIKFTNASAQPSATTWHIGTNTLTAATAPQYVDASNDLTISWDPAQQTAEGISTYYAPLLTNGTDSFQLAERVTPVSGNIDNGFLGFPLASGTIYYGAPGPQAYLGDMTNGSYKQIAFYQPFDAPIGTLTVNEITLLGWRNGGSVVDAAKNIRLGIYNVTKDEDGETVLGDSLLATFSFVADSVKFTSNFQGGKSGSTRGLLNFYPLVDDGLGGQMIQPVDLNKEFAVVVTGFSGTNTGFYFAEAPEYMVQSQTTDQSTNRTTYTFDSNAFPNSHIVLQDSTSNRAIDTYYLYSMYPFMELHGYQNYARFFLSSQEDNGTETRFTEFTAPTTGGVAVNDSAYAAQLYTALPWQDADGNNNYSISVNYNGETPWLVGLTDNDDNTYSIDQVVSSSSVDQSKSFVNTANWANYGMQVVGFVAESLPSGKSGRHANIRINYNGNQTSEIIVRQGDDNTVAGIDKVAVDNNNGASRFDNRVYNLAGQQVNKAYKGIVISNGKKYIQK